jgi:hypothetical protein
MNHYNSLQSNNCTKPLLSYSEFTKFEEAIASQRMQQMDCEWGWFCTAEDENNPHAIYPQPVMNFTHKKSLRPILVKKHCNPYAVSPMTKPNIMELNLSELVEEKDSGILSNKLFYYLSHCAVFSVIVLISTYS